MATESRTVDFAELETHAAWVRRLARSLVTDAQAADDVVQETWLAALRHGPAEGRPLGPWLARVARNVVFQRRRKDASRARVEAAVPEAESEPAAPEALARVEAHGRVVRAVLALDEPHRTVVIRRYFDGLSSAEIARDLGVPAATIRSQLKRALERIRTRLDADAGGDGRSWCVALAPVLGADGVPWGGLIVMTKSFKVLAAAALLFAAVGTFAVVTSGSDDPPPVSGGRVASTAGVVAPGPGTGAAGSAARTEQEVAVAAEVRRAAEAVAADGRTAVFLARFLRSDGAPAEGVAMRLTGEPTSPDLVAHVGRRTSFEEVSAVSGMDGRVTLAIEPPPAITFTAEATFPGHARESWWFFMKRIEPGTVWDLGDVELLRAGTIEGHVLDAAGRPVQEGWTIEVEEERQRRPHDAPASGERFRVDGVRPGTCVVFVRFDSGVRSGGTRVEVRSGEVTQVELRIDLPDVADRIDVRRHDARTGEWIDVLPGHTRLTGVVAGPLAPVRRGFFEGVPADTYALTIDDPRFEPVHLSGVRPGGPPIEVELRGSSGLALVVRDGGGGAALSGYSAALRIKEPAPFRHAGATFLVKGDDEDPPPVIDRLVAGSYDLVVRAEGYPEKVVPIDDLRAGEVRAVEVRLDRGGTLEGVVLEADGRTSGRDLDVYLHETPTAPPEEVAYVNLETGEAPRAPTPGRPSYSIARVGTDAGGRFRFTSLPPGDYTIRVRAAETFQLLERALVSSAAPDHDLRIILPSRHDVAVRLLLPSGADPTVLFLRARSAAVVREEVQFSDPDPDRRVRVRSDGTVRIGPFAPGLLELTVETETHTFETSLASGLRTIVVGSAPVPLDAWTLGDERTVERTFDLRRRAPGSIVVDTTLNGAPEAGLLVVAADGAVGETDAAGVARLGSVFPGRYRLTVYHPGEDWAWSSPREVVVDAQAERRVAVSVPVATAKVRFVDGASGAPLGAASFTRRIRSGPIDVFSRASLDDDGQVSLRLPIGRHRLWMMQRQREVWLDWPPAGGAAPTIEVPGD